MSWAAVAGAGIIGGTSLLGSVIGGGGSRNQNTSGSSTSSSSNTGTQSSSAMPVVPEGWFDAYMGSRPGAGGLSPSQNIALANLLGMQGAGQGALSGPAKYFQNWSDNSATTLESIYANYPEIYQRPEDVVAGMVGARTGASFMDTYRNPFEDEVVQAALGDLDRSFGRRQTALDNRLAASGAFGGSASALENALLSEDFLRTASSTSGNLRARGFETAAGLGMQDAGRTLQADMSNRDAAMQAALANRAAEQQRQMFDVEAVYRNEDARRASARDWASLLGNGLSFDNAAALNLLTAGGVGLNQDLNWLRGGLPLFGQESSGESATTGSTSGTSTGTGAVAQQPGFGNMLGAAGNVLAGLGQLGWNPFGAGATSGAGTTSGAGLYPSWASPWS